MIKKGVKVAQISSSFLIYFHLLPVATEDGKQFQCIKKVFNDKTEALFQFRGNAIDANKCFSRERKQGVIGPV